MHDVLKERIWRRLEVLPPAQLYEVLDFIEFLEAKYAKDAARKPDGFQRFAERLEDGLRVRSVAPKVISGTVGLLGTARKVVRSVGDAGRDLLGALESPSPSSPPDRPRLEPPAVDRPAPAEGNGTSPEGR